MKKTTILLTAIFSQFAVGQLRAQVQRKLTEATISYDIVINTSNSNPQAADLLDGATSVIYLKGSSSRSEMISSLGTQATIIDGKTGNVVLLKDYGEKRYMIKMTPENWKQSIKKYDSVSFTYFKEYKMVAGYNCQKAVGRLMDNTTFTVYFTKELLPVNKDFQYLNKNLPGLAMEYEAAMGKTSVTYRVSNINFNPVPKSKMDIPQSGYRVMTYEESKGAGIN
jgi:GLPGLI family protein